MIKVKIEGPGAKLVSNVIHKALRDAGIDVNTWSDVKPSEVANCRRAATKAGADVSIVATTR